MSIDNPKSCPVLFPIMFIDFPKLCPLIILIFFMILPISVALQDNDQQRFFFWSERVATPSPTSQIVSLLWTFPLISDSFIFKTSKPAWQFLAKLDYDCHCQIYAQKYIESNFVQWFVACSNTQGNWIDSSELDLSHIVLLLSTLRSWLLLLSHDRLVDLDLIWLSILTATDYIESGKSKTAKFYLTWPFFSFSALTHL